MKHCHLRGSILPLAIVMTVSILLSGVTVGLIVLEGYRRSATTDNAMVAYYAADGGIERQLYDIRKNNKTIADIQAESQSYSNGSSWVTANPTRFVNATVKTFPVVNNGDFQFVDLFDPDAPGAAAGIAKVMWTWNDGGAPGCEVELAYTPWLNGGAIIPDQYTIVLGILGGGTQNLQTDHAYRLRFRPKNCNITNLQVQVYNNVAGPAVVFPGDITLASQGAYKNSQQAMAVTMPRLDILNNVFSYVIFSECTLFKNPGSPDPECP
jgi:hypothetical protein